MMQLDASFWDQLDGSVSLGLSYTKAQDQSTLSFSSWVQRRSTLRKTRLDLSSTVTNTAASEQSVRYDFSLSHQRLLQRILFAEVIGSAQRNDELGLDLRTSIGAGFGANLIQSNRTLLVAGFGLSVNREWANDGTRTDNIEAMLGGDHAIFTYNFPKTDYSLGAAFYPSLSDWGRVRLDIDLHAKREIVSNFYLELTYYENFDNRPPGGGEKTDYGFTLGVSWTF
jgi:putative salt-induced outer membrane protein YdiY